jgi:hypothetical protein
MQGETIEMRLLFCEQCKTMEEAPDYEGSSPVDPIIEALVLKHNERDPMGHGGKQLHHSPMRIAVVDDEKWALNRDEVLKTIQAENKRVGLADWAYENMNTFAEDALKCYSQHHRPKEGCIDYWDESKRIGHPTDVGNKMAHVHYKLAQKRDPHLCQFCPVHTFVQTEINWKAGLYK